MCIRDRGKDKEKKTPELTVSPKDILLVPEPKRQVTNKGPKPGGSFDYILPYKDALLAAGEKRKESDSAEGKRKLKDKKKKDDQQPTKKTQSKTKQAVKKKLLNDSDVEPCESDIESEESVLEISIGVENPGDEEGACLFCGGPFSADNRGELWVQCLICEMWAHNDCAGCEKDVYVCDFCKQTLHRNLIKIFK